jgi:predicted amidohydrolase YtcJ
MRVPPNGEVVADAEGSPTGLLMEQAAWRAWTAAPQPDARERAGHVRGALAHLHQLGYAQVHEAMSVWLYAPVDEAGAFSSRPWESERVRFAGLKAFADGTLNSRTALMTVAYHEPSHNAHAPPGEWMGRAMMTPAQLRAAMEAADALGAGLAVHAIGDGAVRMVLDEWEKRARRGGMAPNGTPSLRIEHAELVDERDVPRFARMGVTCSVQPCHLLCDVEALTRYLPHRLDRVLPLRELIDSGCRPGELLWFGSDSPIVPADPMDSIAAATKRRRPEQREAEAIAWGQRIGADEAWAAFCADGAG